ncbi:ArsR/SmtB family transcription factor [Amycolatopsis samaneae]
MITSLGPVAESVFALDLFRRGGGVFGGWQRRVRDGLGHRVAGIEKLTREHLPLTDLQWLLERQLAEQAQPEDRNQERVAAAVFEFCQVAVVPYWSHTRSCLEAERDVRGRVLITVGVEGLLSSLHPKMRWTPPTLEIAGQPRRDVHLDGRGLLLSPSLFLIGRSGVLIDARRASTAPVLAFAVPPSPAVLSGMWGSWKPNEQALGALVGHTRAAALQALTDSCTTGELSQRLGISLAGASKHATILREAGLVETTRNRNTALHTLTPLGVALLQSRRVAPRRSEHRTPVKLP